MDIKNKAAKELGKRGGLKTLENKGKDHFKKIAKDRWNKAKAVDKSSLTP